LAQRFTKWEWKYHHLDIPATENSIKKAYSDAEPRTDDTRKEIFRFTTG
jgi:hypothetical protein